jgi:hypothetical protein
LPSSGKQDTEQVTAYEYGSEPKRLELPNPYRLQNRLLWLCGALLVAAGVVSLLWAKSAMQENALRLAAAPIVAGLLLRHFDVAAPWQTNRYSLAGDSAILAFVATFCFQAASRLWGRFNFVVLTWVEMMGNYPTSRIGTGNNFSSRVNTENNVVRTEAMTLRVWRARTESVVFGKDDARQITAMFTTEQEARALTAELMQFARSQSVLVAPFSGEDEQRMAALGAGERAMLAGSGAIAPRIANRGSARFVRRWAAASGAGPALLHGLRHRRAGRGALLRELCVAGVTFR